MGLNPLHPNEDAHNGLAYGTQREPHCYSANENPLYQKKADIKYYNVGDYLSGDKKLMALQSNGKPKKITEFDFEDIIPR